MSPSQTPPPSGGAGSRAGLINLVRDLPIPRKLSLIIGLFSVVICALLLLSYFGLEMLSGSRAYVGGEALWSKAQKSAAYRLTRYALFHEEADYQEYLAHIAVALGDRAARLELARPDMDFAEVQRGFVQGRNHPDDVPVLAFMARHFDRARYMREAIRLWEQADAGIDRLHAVALELRREIRSGVPAEPRIRALLADLHAIDAELTEIEDAFSYTLGEGARWLKSVLLWTMIATTLLFLATALTVAFFISRHLSRSIERLRAGAARIAGGDYSITLEVSARDEVGDLARSFQAMASERQRAERMKDEFFANVSHELRTPLTLILSPLESLLTGDYGRFERRAGPALHTMHNNAVRLLQLVNGLLDFAKLEAGQIHVQREPLDAASLTEAVYRDFQPLMRERGIVGELRLEAAIAVMLDRYFYERILFNLLSNAVKFTPREGRISVNLVLQGSRLTLTVADTGIGIAPEQQVHIFERFRQAEGSSTRRFEGTGLGLALVKEFAELLGGTVSLRSALGQGSTFEVECEAPRAEGHAAPAAAPPRERQSMRLEHPTRAITAPREVPPAHLPAVLVAEDNPEMAAYIASLLRPLAAVSHACDGNAAWEKLKSQPFDLLLTDVMMPGRDGFDLCRQVKADPAAAHIPVVMLTALTHREALLEGWKAGADEYLFKPFHPHELTTRIQALLRARALKQEADRHIEALNQSLLQRAADLEAANRELETFSYSVSHDLRGPLRIIDGFSEILLDLHLRQLDEDGQRLLVQVRQAAQRMGQLIDDLQKLSHINRTQIERTGVDLSGMAQAVTNELKLREPQRAVQIDIAPGLAAQADGRLVRIVLDNLLGNAWKFTSKEQRPRIQFAAEPRAGRRVFFVRDNGAGFDMQRARKLFIPFQRLHSREDFPGTGIGLATVHRIIERHAGKIWAESAPGRGATFYFTLEPEPDANQSVPSAADPPLSPPASAAGSSA